MVNDFGSVRVSATTAALLRVLPELMIEAHLRAVEPDLDLARMRAVIDLVLQRHSTDEVSMESLLEILLEVEREYRSP